MDVKQRKQGAHAGGMGFKLFPMISEGVFSRIHVDIFEIFIITFLLSSSTRKRWYHQQPSGQAVVTGVSSLLLPGTCIHFCRA